MIAVLLDRLRHKDRNALARLLTLASLKQYSAELEDHFLASPPGREARTDKPSTKTLTPHPSRTERRSEVHARVIAFTGSGGVGKSTLIGKLIPLIRAQGQTIAVLACDPQSPLTGGALLGDRFRMGSQVDDGLFIRSLATTGGHGGLAEHIDVMILLLKAYGFDIIILETVGSGQGDVAVRQFADVVVLLVQPESGDDVQWEKAGILECADIVVVHKSDLPTADETAAQVRSALDLSPARLVPVIRVSTKANTGHAELWQAIQSSAASSAARIIP